MHQQQQQPEYHGAMSDLRSLLGWAVFVSRVMSVTVEVFLRTGFGVRYIGMQALIGLFAIPLWGSFYPEHDVRYLVYFMYAYLAMVLVARTSIVFRWFRGDLTHSYYNGRPRLGRLCPWMREMTIKKLVEPCFVFVLGTCLCEYCYPLGTYLMFAAGCLFFSTEIIDMAMRKRARDMQDALIDQVHVMDMFRDPRGR